MKSTKAKRRRKRQQRQRDAKNKKGAVLKNARRFDDSLRLENADEFINSLLDEILAQRNKTPYRMQEKFDCLNAILANLFVNRTTYTYLSMSEPQYKKHFPMVTQFVPECVRILIALNKIKSDCGNFDRIAEKGYQTRIRIERELNISLRTIPGIRPTKLYPKELVELRSRVQYKLDETGKRVKKKSRSGFKYEKVGGELIDYKSMNLPHKTKKEINRIRTDLQKLNELNGNADIQLFIECQAMAEDLKTYYDERYNFVDLSPFKVGGCIPIDTRLKAVYTDNFDCHGRLYATGMFRYQGLRKQYRPFIKINNESTIEYDFSSLHPNLLYADVGQELRIKPYQFDELSESENRILKPLLKTMFLAMINAKTEGFVFKAMMSWLFYGFKDNYTFHPNNYGSLSGSDKDLYESVEVVKKYFEFGAALRKFDVDLNKIEEDNIKRKKAGEPTKNIWSYLIQSIRNKFLEIHKPINHFLDSKNDDTGLRLMNKDSRICLDVCGYFRKKQIPILPLHDSFLIQEKYGAELSKVMMDTYSQHTKNKNIIIHENKRKKRKKDYCVIDGKVQLNPKFEQELLGYASE